jgi:SpoIID/LytB domain protein
LLRIPRLPRAAVRARCGRLLAAGLVLIAAIGGVVATATPASAAPATISLNGHGWGHGRGMGQYGAQGYAGFGWTSASILDHFYSNTVAAALAPNQQMSVRITSLDGLDVAITSQSEFQVDQYVMQPGQAVYFRTDGAGNYFIRGATGCGGSLLPEVQVAGPVFATSRAGDPGNDLTKMLSICGGNTYRGALAFILEAGSPPIEHTVNLVGLEDYLRGVVPRESPSWFASAALQAQAVAARSYSMGEGGEGGQRYAYAKTCDSTACQVYGGAAVNGTRLETASTDAAIAQTAGLVRRFGDGSLARTEFSSSTGGWTAGGVFPAVPDDGDSVASNPNHNWVKSLSTSALASYYAVGSFVDLQITQRNGFGDWGGRPTKVAIVGTTKTVTVTGAQFQGNQGLLSDWFTTDASNGPGAVSPLAGRTDVFARGTDSAVWQRTEAQTLGAWASQGGTFTSDVDASSWGGNRIDLFGRGVDDALWHKSYDGGVWSTWQSLGGVLASGPTAVSWGPNRVDVFAKGTDGALWQKTYTAAGWGNWTSLGGLLIGDPDVASWSSDRLDIFVRGIDGALWHRWFNGGWGPWESIGGTLASSPGVVSWGPNRIDMFVRGTDGALWSRYWDGAAWGAWYSLGGGITSDPDAAAPGVFRLEVVARGPDGAIWQRTWSGPSWSAWYTLGPPK